MHDNAVKAIVRAFAEGLGIIIAAWALLAIFGSYIGFVAPSSGNATGYFAVLVIYTTARAIYLVRKGNK